MKITKAIITAAGLGTRFLPASKAYQKEMIPVMGKPQLHYVIAEAVESGITEIAIVVRQGINTVQRYLADDDKFWHFLKENGKESYMDEWRNIKEKCRFTILEQGNQYPYGNGIPFIVAQDFAQGEPVVGMWGDDIVLHLDQNQPAVVRQMLKYYEDNSPTAVMAAFPVKKTEINRYGCFDYEKSDQTQYPYQIKQVIEKPEPEKAPSLMASIGRFVIDSEIFHELEKQIKGKNDEVWLTDAVERVIKKGKIVMAPPFEGSVWMTTGDPIRWLRANLVVALNDDHFREETKQLLKEID